MRKLKVYLFNTFIGILKENKNGNLSFKYNKNIKKNKKLSIRIPVSDTVYNDKYIRPFFENILPEGDIRESVSNISKISKNNIFSLLQSLGEDCAGAVTLLDENSELEDIKTIEKRLLSDNEVFNLIKNQDNKPLLTRYKRRLSLAGAQKKFALTIKDDKFYLPDFKNPTTHIIKPDNPEFPELIYNEDFCMKLAKSIGLDVPETKIKTIENISFLIVKRFDRMRFKEGFKKLHQEDFCQATGTVSFKKYQKEGGPSFKNCYDIVRNHSKTAAKDSISLIKWLVFNLFISNQDAHAKNISLIHDSKGEVSLAPFYDLVCTGVYPGFSGEMAMRVGKKYDWNKIRKKDLLEIAKQINIKERLMEDIIDKTIKDIKDNSKILKEKLSRKYPEVNIYNKILSGFKKRL